MKQQDYLLSKQSKISLSTIETNSKINLSIGFNKSTNNKIEKNNNKENKDLKVLEKEENEKKGN
jgi:hypothetical protein